MRGLVLPCLVGPDAGSVLAVLRPVNRNCDTVELARPCRASISAWAIPPGLSPQGVATMARPGPQTQAKRQREQKKREKREAKKEKMELRRAEKQERSDLAASPTSQATPPPAF